MDNKSLPQILRLKISQRNCSIYKQIEESISAMKLETALKIRMLVNAILTSCSTMKSLDLAEKPGIAHHKTTQLLKANLISDTVPEAPTCQEHLQDFRSSENLFQTLQL